MQPEVATGEPKERLAGDELEA